MMIKRFYFVAYQGPEGLIGSFVISSKSLLPKKELVFNGAVDHVKSVHKNAAIVKFNKI